MSNEKILLIDAGSQYLKLIDRTIRELNVETEICNFNITAKDVLDNNYKGIIISGSHHSVNDQNIQVFDYGIFDLNIPILGICYGMQMLVKHYGGIVERLHSREDAQTKIVISQPSPIFKGLEHEQTVLLTHGDCCTGIPDSFVVNSFSASKVAVSICCESRLQFGVQFHPEVNLTVNGRKMLYNFLFEVCNCFPSFTLSNRLNECTQYLMNGVSEKNKVIVLVSGGVDSTVAAALARRALPNHQILCFMVDHGFLRLNEASNVEKALKSIGLDITVICCPFQFLNSTTYVRSHEKYCQKVGPLTSEIDSENKRKIIGDTFIKVIEDKLEELNLEIENCILVQGTLRPDLIESASSLVSQNADVIKTHHNDTELIRRLRERGRVLEPLKDFHKDEVRRLGMELGLPISIIQRYPFPGPGLAIRIICAEDGFFYGSDSKFDVCGLANFIINYHKNSLLAPHPIITMLENALSSTDISSLLSATKDFELKATILPIRSVGVQGDGRTYKNVMVLSSDMPVKDWECLYTISKIIPKVCTSTSRVVFAFGGKVKYSVTDVTRTHLTPEVVKLCQTVDNIVEKTVNEAGIYSNISQFPVIIIPIHFDHSNGDKFPPLQRSVVLRPFISDDFMTGIPAIPDKHFPVSVLNDMVEKLQATRGVSRILYDLTQKPPGTVEWE